MKRDLSSRHDRKVYDRVALEQVNIRRSNRSRERQKSKSLTGVGAGTSVIAFAKEEKDKIIREFLRRQPPPKPFELAVGVEGKGFEPLNP